MTTRLNQLCTLSFLNPQIIHEWTAINLCCHYLLYKLHLICFILSIYQLKERQQRLFLQEYSGDEVSGWVSSFLTAHQHISGYLVPWSVGDFHCLGSAFWVSFSALTCAKCPKGSLERREPTGQPPGKHASKVEVDLQPQHRVAGLLSRLLTMKARSDKIRWRWICLLQFNGKANTSNQ